MLTCEICGEEMLLEEDMKTHLLLSHLENDMCCPLCCLSGVSFDELCFHITSAHPEERHREQAHRTSRTERSATHSAAGASKSSQACQSGSAGHSCDGIHSCVSVPTDSVQPRHKTTPGGAYSSPGKPASITSILETQKSVESDENAVKLKELPLSRKERLFSCPMCNLVCSSSFVLQEHVELHLQDQCSAEARRFECPVCSVVCSDSFSLQEHVELHLDQRAAVSGAGSPALDLKLAKQLQQEEEHRRRQEEALRERQEFKKLQRQFGLDGRGGYRRQMEMSMERAVTSGILAPVEFHRKRAEMMESLASGIDDGRTRTQGVIGALCNYYQTEGRDVAHVWLSADTDHYCSSAGDKGWGCGYRNFQMLFSALHRIDSYSCSLQERLVPSIPQLQSLIEEAWKEGLDPQGASHFNQQLQGTRAWIGATEIYALRTSLGISASIIDFHMPTGPGDTHPQLFDWVKQYFSQSSRGSRLPSRLIQTTLPPLYLQHEGHSRSIIGLEQKNSGSLCLLLLDPGSSPSHTRKLLSRDTVSTAIRSIRKFPTSLKHKQYQVVAAQGVLSAAEKQMRILNSRILCAERIP
ncbi:zinc finger-containing ubiquitin peptidase 1 isoform X2 [Archocentrus centrarchus]|uniref:zinc finger-containing ubiquitin peptidase 1 isoform X2 n=1 Tax=Archocentrus centrarchus TaxID=63155 RepID=UPI0011E9C73B|nr:zinc finger-containing ubiquitin peptidase 1 isoform X2 [Archocentrus centrarchus]